MIQTNKFLYIVTFTLLSGLFFSQSAHDSDKKSKSKDVPKENTDMTLHDFMEDYVEAAEKKFKKGNKEPLKKILEFLPETAIPEDKEEWQKITEKYLASEEYLASCKACHSKFKKSYKKSYKKRLVTIPKEILNLK
ncbi:MAG TPA: hypothetical protein PK079_16355 [Leptospiraceae bacterium]|nr:hypothetical protein [Leptospiraceae bacterium]HMW07029.1 hypothetical protein [Leptospiraceae bacterium]HMX35052.1 hypothetical protein [Leptospiraceae bacterium]HMY33834.1 hypothetical protein [Leptospiraceae bacterium]HMZ66471.1 hypothetical protein [Leptospiraceae bacterium]